MTKLNVISIDLAKNVFQACGMSQKQKVVFNRSLKRKELLPFITKQMPTIIAMEACYSSHHWARQFQQLGHTVKLLPAQHVTPFVRGNKSDANDAVAIAEAAHRPFIRDIPIKTIEQQEIQSLHRLRECYVAHRTGLINQTRGLLSEYGIIAPKGHKAFNQLLSDVTQSNSNTLPPRLKQHLKPVLDEYYWQTERIEEIQMSLTSIANQNSICKFLLSIPGIGVINATALYSAIGKGQQFSSGRELAVWLGLTPRQSSSGESFTSSGITKRGNRYLRKQLIHGARAAISRCRNKTDRLSRWANQLVARRGIQKACVAMAARIARLAWTLINKQQMYQAIP